MIPIKSISHPIVIGLRLTGIWPKSSYEIIVRFIWVIIMMCAQIFQYRYIINHIDLDNLADLIDSVSTTLPYSLLCFKLISFWTKREIFKNILIGMYHDWTNALAADFIIKDMIKKTELAYYCSNLIMGIYAIAVFMYVGVFLELNQDQGNRSNLSPELLVKMDLPFTYDESPIYEYVLIVQFIQLFFIASSIAMLDALIITLIFHIGGQIEILHKILKNISIKDEKPESSRIIIKSLIDRHYRIIVGSEYIESLFSYIALMQLICNTLVICCIGFLIVVAVNSNLKLLIRISFFYIAITLEAFIFSIAGEYLSNKSLSVSNSAYESPWYLLSPKNRAVMILLMVRSQRRLTITAGKFMDLSMQGFANVLKASASYISILYAMY
ncbi:odorant receptor 63a-like isoform X2 [Apis florea]|uniref:odorant receptor 63a-like isoform X2 n=1 Tax=Apis florea TaxID=7463 RepID=UPI0012FEE60C|nr:odorant receptor 63a-like isoform X2 [Apis florea]